MRQQQLLTVLLLLLRHDWQRRLLHYQLLHGPWWQAPTRLLLQGTCKRLQRRQQLQVSIQPRKLLLLQLLVMAVPLQVGHTLALLHRPWH